MPGNVEVSGQLGLQAWSRELCSLGGVEHGPEAPRREGRGDNASALCSASGYAPVHSGQLRHFQSLL